MFRRAVWKHRAWWPLSPETRAKRPAIPRVFPQTRNASSLNHRDVASFTNSILNRHKNLAPLGTLSYEQWGDCFAAMTHWLERETGEDPFDASEETAFVSGYAVDTVDRLLNRLLDEHTSLSLASQDQMLHLQEWSVRVLRYWLQLHRDFPHGAYAVDRAERVLRKILVWQRRNVFILQDDVDVSGFMRDVAMAWMRLGSLEGSNRVVDLLLSDLVEVDDTILPCFHTALEFAVRFENPRTSELVEYMKHKAQIPGLEMFKPATEGLPHQDEMSAESLGSLSEEAMPVQDLLDAIKDASAKDLSTVNSLIKQLKGENFSANSSFPNELSVALTDYYTRVGEPHLATTCLRRMNSASHEVKAERCKEIISLWESRNDSESAWRASELLDLLDGLSEEEIDSSVYISVATMWSRSGDPVASHRIFELCARAPFDERLGEIAFKSMLDGPPPSSATLDLAFGFIDREWKNIKAESLFHWIDMLSVALERGQSSALAFAVMHMLSKNEIVPSDETCKHLAGSFSASSSPKQVGELLQLFRASGVTISFECYRAAIASLLDIRDKCKVDETLTVLRRLLDDVRQGLPASAADIRALLLRIIEVFGFLHHERASRQVLEAAEESLLDLSQFSDGFPIPLDCYRKVAAIHFFKNDFYKVQHLFHKVRGYAQAGHLDMVPDNRFYGLVAASLSKKGPGTIEAQEELLQQIAALYRAYGDQSFKPLHSMYGGILLALKAHPTEANVRRATVLLDEAVDLGVDFAQPFCFNTAMHLILKSGVDDTFQLVNGVVSKLEKLDVAPDSYTLHNLLEACGKARPDERYVALETTLKTFEDIRQTDDLHERTYILMFRVLGAVFSSSKQREGEVFSSVFDACCKDGYFSGKVREALESNLSPDLWDSLYEARLEDGRREPAHWSRNVEEVSG